MCYTPCKCNLTRLHNATYTPYCALLAVLEQGVVRGCGRAAIIIAINNNSY